ncbi:MAG: hypothetical protein R3310_15310, partial [Candidatus Competibacteraceae bacterium]|nr:hypothetical protein [Candidatus Competibacteraceae bacterium]
MGDEDSLAQRQRQLLARLGLSLPRLDTLLRAEGFVIGPDRWQNVYDLLLALQEQGRLPERAGELGPWLTPLLCQDAREQARFAPLFRRWLEEQPKQPGIPEARPAAVKPPPEPPPPPSLRWLIVGLVLGVLVLAGGTYGVMRYLASSETVDVIQPPRLAPPSTGPGPDTVGPLDQVLKLQPLPPRAPVPSPRRHATPQARLDVSGGLRCLVAARR